MSRFFVSFTGIEAVDRAFRFVMDALSRLTFSDLVGFLGRSQLPNATLGDGTADATTYLRGDRTWATVSGGGGGETNTGSNAGVGGVGVFDAKVGVDLRFRHVNAASSRVTVALDAGNKEIDIDVDEAALDLANLGGTLGMGQLPANSKESCVGLVIGDGATAIATGYKGDLTVPFAATITGWEVVGDNTGSIVIDVWKDTFANYPPTGADTIAGTEKPTLSAAQKAQDLTLSTWTTSISAGDVLAFNVDSVSGLNRVRVQLFLERT